MFNSNYTGPYTELSKHRIIFLSEDITKQTAATLCGLLIYYNGVNKKEDIHLFINTNGGDVAALSSIYDVMSLIDAPISTIGMGRIYSAGAFLLAAGAKDKRFMYRNAEVMIHGLQCSFPQELPSNQKDSASYYDYLNALNKRILKILAKHTGQSIKKIESDSSRDLYLTAEDALKYNMIDSILG